MAAVRVAHRGGRSSYSWTTTTRAADPLFGEVRDIPEWETIAGNVLCYDRNPDITTNTHREFINKFALSEHSSITTPLFRTYLLDLAPQASDQESGRCHVQFGTHWSSYQDTLYYAGPNATMVLQIDV